MPIELPVRPKPAREFRVTGRFVLITFVLFFAVVATVNGIMMTIAIRTFPGIDAKNGYEVSQTYNKEIASARAQAERGWQSGFTVSPAGDAAQLALSLRDKAGQPVAGLSIDARLLHPSDRKRDHVVTLTETQPGVYEAAEKGVTAGFWNVHIEARRGPERVYVLDTNMMLK